MTEAANPPLIDRIYLDTQPLRASQWPSVSVTLAGILALARRVNVPVFVPAVVQLERRAQFVRDLHEEWQKAQRSAKSVATQLARIGVDWQPPQLPYTRDLLAAYDNQSAAAIAEYGLLSIEPSNRPAMDYFEALLARRAPFDSKGRGLGDAMIFESIVEHLDSNPANDATLITVDSDFSPIPDLAKERGVRLRTMSTEAITESLMEHLAVPAIKRLETRLQALYILLGDQQGALLDFVRQHLEFPVNELAGVFETVESIDEMAVAEIGRAATKPQLWKEVEDGTVLNLTLRLKVRLSVTVTTTQQSPPRKARVGEPIPAAEWTPAARVVESRQLDREVEVQGTIRFNMPAAFSDLQLEKVDLVASNWGTIGALLPR